MNYYISHAEKFPSDQRPKAPLFISLNYTATEQREKREWVSLFKTRKVIEPHTVTKTLEIPLLLYSQGPFAYEFFSRHSLGHIIPPSGKTHKGFVVPQRVGGMDVYGTYIDEGYGSKLVFQTWYYYQDPVLVMHSSKYSLVEMCSPEEFLEKVNAVKKQLAEAGISEEELVSHINKMFDAAENKKVEKSAPVKSEAEKELEEMLK